MIRITDTLCQLITESGQGGKEAGRMAYARQCIHRSGERRLEGRIVAHAARRGRHQRHGVFPLGRGAAVADDGIDPLEAGHGFAQRPHGEQAAIAEAPGPIHHHQFDVPGQGVVLQAVVGDDDVHLAALLKQTHRIGALGCHHHGAAAAPGDEHRLIPRLGRGAGGVQPIRVMGRLAPITPTDHTGAPATGLQLFHQPDHHRGLAVAADRDIAHHYHRQAGPIAAEPAAAVSETAPAADQGKQQGQGGQRPAPATLAVPETIQHQPLLLTVTLPN
ncbi:hypothetical protein D3C77_297770 [compost metagenome]